MDIIVTIQLALLVLAIPVVRLLIAWKNFLDAKAYREEEAGSRDHTLAVVAMVQHGIIKAGDAREMLVDEDEDEYDQGD